MGLSLRCLVRLVDLNVQPYSYKLVCVLLRVHKYLCKWLYSTVRARYRYSGICVFLNPRLPKVTSTISRASFIKNLGNNFRKKRFLSIKITTTIITIHQLLIQPPFFFTFFVARRRRSISLGVTFLFSMFLFFLSEASYRFVCLSVKHLL